MCSLQGLPLLWYIYLPTCATFLLTSPYTGRDCQNRDWPSHKTNCKRPNYILKVHLAPDDITDPQIIRTISCPATATFEKFYRALQITFGWSSTHTYDFKVKDPQVEAEEAAADDNDAILRIIRRMGAGGGPMPDSSPDAPRYLLRLVEESRGGPFSGLEVDVMHNVHRKNPLTPEKKSTQIRLHEVLDKQEYQGMPFEYEYDFGDCWCHEITLIGRANARDKFICTGDEGHGCAEDAGSCRGWQKLKEAYRADRPSRDQKEKKHWCERQASNADSQGLGGGRDSVWDQQAINRMLARL